MSNLLFSAHDDDQALYSSFLCIRKRPLVVLCTDSFIQPLRGDMGCSAEERAKETEEACKILDCEVIRLGIRDDQISDALFRSALEQGFDPNEKVYLPALQGGNFAHDIVSRVGSEFFRDVTYYATYSKGEHFSPIGEPVIPTEEELALKNRALDCYQSQISLASTRPHFEAVRGQPEYLLEDS
jgi:LmbE family N-acetylglucosaminyl deacetylase